MYVHTPAPVLPCRCGRIRCRCVSMRADAVDAVISHTHNYTYIEYISAAEILRFCNICMSVCLPHNSHTYRALSIGTYRPSRKFISLGEVTPCASEWWCKTKIKKGQRSRSLVTKCKDRFSCISHQKWIDLRQTKTEMIKGTLQTHIVECISPAEMPRFVTFV